MSKPTNFDIPQSLEVVWTALHEYQDECIPEGGTVRATCPEESDEVEAMAKQNEDLWSDITTSMAWITEALNLEIDSEGEYQHVAPWVESENILDIEVRNVYGIDRFYPANDKAREMAEMLYGRKTMNQEDLLKLQRTFGFEICLTNAVAHNWLPGATSKLGVTA